MYLSLKEKSKSSNVYPDNWFNLISYPYLPPILLLRTWSVASLSMLICVCRLPSGIAGHIPSAESRNLWSWTWWSLAWPQTGRDLLDPSGQWCRTRQGCPPGRNHTSLQRDTSPTPARGRNTTGINYRLFYLDIYIFFIVNNKCQNNKCIYFNVLAFIYF